MKIFNLLPGLLVLIFLFISCGGNTPTAAVSSGTISGIVYDASAGTPINKARVITVPPTSSVTTNDSGAYEITNVEPGTYHINAAKFAFDSAGVDISVSADVTTTADIPLLPDSLRTP